MTINTKSNAGGLAVKSNVKAGVRFTGNRTMRALTVRGRVSTRVRTGALRQATFSSTLILGAREES